MKNYFYARAEDDDDNGVWAEAHDMEQDTPTVGVFCPSWIQLCYGAGIVQKAE